MGDTAERSDAQHAAKLQRAAAFMQQAFPAPKSYCPECKWDGLAPHRLTHNP